MHDEPIAAGKSSFDLVDVDLLFSQLELQAGCRFLDIACGTGRYSLVAATRVGQGGTVYAFDLWADGIAALDAELDARQLTTVQSAVVDVTKAIPVQDASIDVCLLATVLHDFLKVGTEQGALADIARVVRPGGMLAVVEFKVIEGPPGPPIGIRITEEKVRDLVSTHGFSFLKTVEVGPYNYLSLFRRDR